MSLVHPAGLVTFSGLATSKSLPMGLCAYLVAALPTDPIGTTTVTFIGVNAGTEIRVYLPDSTELAGVELCTANQVLSWPVYAPGANSVVTIRLINTAYKIKEFDYTSIVGNQALPVQQERDPWYSNPI